MMLVSLNHVLPKLLSLCHPMMPHPIRARHWEPLGGGSPPPKQLLDKPPYNFDEVFYFEAPSQGSGNQEPGRGTLYCRLRRTISLITKKKHWRKRRNSAPSCGWAARRWRTVVKAKLTCDLSFPQPSLEVDNGPEVVVEWGFNGGNSLSINIEKGATVSVIKVSSTVPKLIFKSEWLYANMIRWWQWTFLFSAQLINVAVADALAQLWLRGNKKYKEKKTLQFYS